ncbi:Uncharacterised protein [Acinetobacter baumannii]|nr:Uncharacterised protein [Acinetobacter baumannii]
MRLAQLAHLRRVDVHVDHFGVRREGIQLAGHAVIETRADGDQQIALLYRQVSGLGAVHAQHAEVQRILRIRRAQPLQGGDVRHAGHGDELAQRRHRLRHAHAAADVQHRFMRLRQQLSRLGQRRRR